MKKYVFYTEVLILNNSFALSHSVTTGVVFCISTMKLFVFFLLNYRFLFILLGPLGKGQQYHEIGRSIATLMTDEVFIQVHWEHFPLLSTLNFWSSCIHDYLLWIRFLSMEPPSFYASTIKFPLEKFVWKG